MKNLLIVLFVLTSMTFSQDIQAQTCTKAQVEACKKLVGDNAKCTPAQAAACKKICKSNAGAANATAVRVVNKAPEKAVSCQKASATATAGADPIIPVKLVGLDLEEGKKKASCSKPCVKNKE